MSMYRFRDNKGKKKKKLKAPDKVFLVPLPICEATGKVIHPSQRIAESLIKNLKRRKHNRPEYLRSYHCEHCNGHHLTSMILIDNEQIDS